MAATYTKPSTVPIWADTSSNIIEPPLAKKNEGWLFEEIPPSSFENWRANLLGNWIKWLDERLDDESGGPDSMVINNPANGSPSVEIGSSLIAINKLEVQDSYFNMDLISSNSRITFDQYDWCEYDRTGNTFKFYIASQYKLEVNNTRIKTPGGVTITDDNFDIYTYLGDPTFKVDNLDYAWFDRSQDKYAWVIANSTEMELGSSLLDITNNGRFGGGLVVNSTSLAADATNKLIQINNDEFYLGFWGGGHRALVFEGLGVTSDGNIHYRTGDNTMVFVAGATTNALELSNASATIGDDLEINGGLVVGSTSLTPVDDVIKIANDDFRISFNVSTGYSIYFDNSSDHRIYYPFAGGDEIFHRISGTDVFKENVNGISPGANNTYELGSNTNWWKNVYCGHVTIHSYATAPVINRHELHRTNLCSLTAKVTAAGALTGSYNWNVTSVTRTGVGVYTITVNENLSSTGITVASPNNFAFSGVSTVNYGATIGVGTFQSTGAPADVPFSIIATG